MKSLFVSTNSSTTCGFRFGIGGQLWEAKAATTPPGHYELCRHLSVAPTRKALELVRLSPAQTVVIHLDRVPPSVAEVWRSSDPSVIGFRLANIIGDAIVWEREVEPPQTSPKLIIESVDLAWSRRWLQRRVRLNLSVRPAQEQVGWRHVHSGVTMLKITITDANGSRHIYRRPLALPPYILPGQKVNVPINHISWIDSVASIRIEGEKVETYQRHFDEASRPVD
ncbi:MAG: hypothetical protein KatS3mg105_1400 [Gemmatales bacterium]|nr:MAG: hypothetical protein KatS3mg105_1400 [Gemmatales bacterium]